MDQSVQTGVDTGTAVTDSMKYHVFLTIKGQIHPKINVDGKLGDASVSTKHFWSFTEKQY